MKKASLVVLMCGITAALCLAAGAQPPEPPPPPPHEDMQGPPPDIEQSRELIEQVMVTRLSRRLGLTDEQSVVLMRRFAEVREEQMKLRRERMEVMRDLRQVLRLEEDEAELARLMARLDAVNTKSATAEEDIRKAFADMNLNVWQKAKLEVFLSEFEGEMRRVVQHARGGGDPMMDGRGGPQQMRQAPGPDGMGPGGGPRGRIPRDEMGRPRPGGRAGEADGPRMPRRPDMPERPRRPEGAPPAN